MITRTEELAVLYSVDQKCFIMKEIKVASSAAIKVLEYLTPAFDLAIRIWVAKVFWQAGWQKIQSWDSTLALFEYEYEVPFLSPELAAWLGTGVELAMPVLLVLGLGGRLSAVILFVLNIVAAISYPDISIAGMKDHYLWGVMLLLVVFHGPGKLSIDHFIRKHYMA